jgi:hypothetical protein
MEANGVELKMSISFRPSIDGQTKRVNLVIQQFLRNYVAANQQDWVDHLELAEFCYNNSKHFVTSGPFSNGDKQDTNRAHDLGSTWITLE